MIQSETDFVFVLFRTQLLNPADIENVKEIQAGYEAQTLSQFLGTPAPAAAPAIAFVKPLSPAEQRTSLEFFRLLNFVLQFCPVHPSETELMARFAKLGIGAGKTFDTQELTPELRQAVTDGMADAWKTFSDFKEKEVDTGKVSGKTFGTREFLKSNYLYRMAAAVLGIYGNSREEASYPSTSSMPMVRNWTVRRAGMPCGSHQVSCHRSKPSGH